MNPTGEGPVKSIGAMRLVAAASLTCTLLAVGDAPTHASPPPDLEGVEEILLALPAAWNARDAVAWVAHFEEGSGFTNILGMHFPDRKANEARHATLFATIFSSSELSAEVLNVSPVGSCGAVAELEFTLVGYERLPPGISETSPGVLRTRLITVLERREGSWHILAAQNTALLPAAIARPVD